MGSAIAGVCPSIYLLTLDHVMSPSHGERSPKDPRGGDYPDLVRLNTKRTVLDAVGRELLERTVADHLAAVDTAMTVFEANGDYATGERPHGWCRVMDELSRPTGDPTSVAEQIADGRWSCRASCRAPALDAMERGSPVDSRCPGGLRVHAAPIFIGSEVVGSISVGCGGPPTDDAQLVALALQLGTSVEQLKRAAAAAKPVSPEAEAVACQTIEATARLLGEMVARRRADAESERTREMSTGMVAHDLRSPLASISMGADSLLKSRDLSQVDAEKVERIRRGTKRMSRMVEDLLDLTRARVGGGISLRVEHQSLAALTADMIEEIRIAHPQHTVRLQSHGDTSLDCDTDRIREVIENLLVNAIRYGDDSPIDVEVSGSPREVLLRVHNGGPPIPADVLPTIFDPFNRGKLGTMGARSMGLGLGLRIAREFVRAHGGTIGVQSGERAGTLFSVSLPRSPSSR